MTESARTQAPPTTPPPASPALAPELDARISAFEHAGPPSDFDAASWFWMMLLGVAIPLLLLIVGWWA
jgi:hypothetical protein